MDQSTEYKLYIYTEDNSNGGECIMLQNFEHRSLGCPSGWSVECGRISS